MSAPPLRRALAAGSLVALVVDLWLLAGPHWDLARDTAPLGAFYDVQGRAFLDGHLAVPPSAVGFEGFVIDGATYLYYGPVLALLRLPALLVTHRLDGRLTQLSMLLAVVVLLWAAADLFGRVRRLVRPDAPIARGEPALAFLVQLAIGAGSVVLYLVATPAVYEETELWGAGLALGAVAAIVAVLERPTGRRIACAGALATLAVNTRVSVGLGPIAALAVLAVLAVIRRDRRAAIGLIAATLVPLATSVAVNQAKFDRPFGLPMDKQVATRLDANRRAALAANDNTIFGPQFVPTTLLATVRPDAVGTVRAFPFIGLPADLPHVVGDVRFDTLQRSLSAPTSMPLLCVLTLVALVGLARRAALRPLFAVLVATAAAYVGALTIGYVTTRYLADLIPFLALGALAGAQLLLARGIDHRWLVAGAGALAVVGLAINAGTGLVDQRLVSPLSAQGDRAAFVGVQDDVDRFLGRRPRGVRNAPALPSAPAGRAGDLLVVGRCAGLYTVSSFGKWLPVERTASTGYHRLALDGIDARLRPVLTVGETTVLAARRQGGLVLGLRVGSRAPTLTRPIAPAPAAITVSFEDVGARAPILVRAGGKDVLGAIAPYEPSTPFHVESTHARELPVPTPVCRAIVRRRS